MKRSCAALLLLLAACLGRSPQNEYRLDGKVPPPGKGFDTALFQAVDVRMKPGNAVDPVDNGQVFQAALEEIGKARKSIHILTFIWSDGRISNQLIDAISARTHLGVECRVLADAIGSIGFDDVRKRLEKAGCQVHMARPLPTDETLARVHRKIMVIDGRVGITGGFGIKDQWDGDGLHDDPPMWRDSNLRVRGPAVLDMQRAFSENWQEASGRLLPADAFPEPEDAGEAEAAFMTSTAHAIATNNDKLTQLFINAATKRIWIANAYFVPSAPILEALARKAREGVDVRVMAAGDKTDTKPYLPSQRARMDDLVRAGARAFEYEPAMMHGKVMIVDDRLVAVGSCNLDALSLNKMDEGALIVDDPRLNAEEARRFLADLDHSKERGPARRTAAR